MQFDKSQILGLLRSQGDHSAAEQADGDLPDTIDTDQHADQLSGLGLNPQALIAKLTGAGSGAGQGDSAGDGISEGPGGPGGLGGLGGLLGR